MSTTWAALDNAVQHLPPGENPYEFVLEQIKSLRSVVGDGNSLVFTINMSVVIGIFVICFIAACFTFITKRKAGRLWFFHAQPTIRGTLIIPNTTSLFTLWSALFTFWSALYVGFLIAALRRQLSPVAAQSVMSLIWIPMCLALFSEAHGIASALYLARQEAGEYKRSYLPPARLFNAVALAYYFLALVPFFALSAAANGKAIAASYSFQGWIEIQAQNWDGVSAFTLDSTGSALVQQYVENKNNFMVYLGNGFKVFMFCILACAIAFLPAAACYLYLLRKQIKSSASTGSSSLLKTASDSTARTERFISRSMSYQLMAIETLLVLFCILAYTALNGWAGFWTKSIMASGTNVILQHILFYYCFAILGTPVNLLIAFRTWASYAAHKFSSSSRVSRASSERKHSLAISVSVVMDQECDKASQASSLSGDCEKLGA